MPTSAPTSSTTPPPMGRGRNVLMIVTGGIAAYKSCIVLRLLQEAGCRVRVAMTESATRMVTPLTFEALSGQAVGTSLWGDGGAQPLDHVHWAQSCDLILVVPATANFLAKMAHGLADDLSSTLISAADAPVLAAPAMNDRMWENPANQENLSTLRARGVEIVEPESGWLACGTVSMGRLAAPELIAERALARMGGGPLAARSVLVTAGGSREAIDAVRYLGNRSSGRMGMALAAAARDLGARVTLCLGPTELAPPAGVSVRRFESAAELAEITLAEAQHHEFVFMAAAVADYRPKNPSKSKWKKSEGPPKLELTATQDILSELGRRKRADHFLAGFALETGSDAELEKEAVRKAVAKKLDLVLGNHADREREGFQSSTNRIFLVDGQGRGLWLGPAEKDELARLIWKRVLQLQEGENDGIELAAHEKRPAGARAGKKKKGGRE
ncbi:MAG TPA: bifunctional phosphopantothenoylcysteine decarboxylase/phosphopantothenate--cysteine ligase CoaBC [Candidatus Krumholzibacteria bacterium]|nr:bifunctional phosphopantothenoylcysteine decarboxylase/phosphopantothenate--cysteine ligase CoaBC [Candidatus Krumholzibacteria bacterium]